MWRTLKHNGFLYPEAYNGTRIPIVYNKQERIILNAMGEHIAVLYSKTKDRLKDETFKRNFWKCWRKHVPKEIKCLELCDFSLLENNELPKYKNIEKYKTCEINSKVVNTSNFLMEPMSIFKGRGDHPLRGTVKYLTPTTNVTLNLSTGAKVPKGKWNSIVHNKDVMWLAMYKDLFGTTKYMFPSGTKAIKARDKDKYDVAKKLKSKLRCINNANLENLRQNVNEKEKQLCIAFYLISNLSIRVGNEKDDDLADTVGCCTLRTSHIHLEGNNVCRLEFLGKDSIRFKRRFKSNEDVYKVLQELIKGKGKDAIIFDKIDSSALNQYLQGYFPELTAKVFRTCNASKCFQSMLQSKEDVMKRFKDAALKTAHLCNHMKTIKGVLKPSINTCLTNYVDPRIVIAFAKRNRIDPSKFYSPSLLLKHSWANTTPSSYVF